MNNKEKTVPEMCQGCTLFINKRWRCPIQEEPGWLYEKFGTCWSKRTDPLEDTRICIAMEKYKKKAIEYQKEGVK
jgi:hypothetical protein